MRRDGGRPSPGMRPCVLTREGRQISPALAVLLVPKEPAESTAFFRFQVQKTPDPRAVYEQGLAFLQADHFQQPKNFSDELTAVLPSGSEVAAALVAHEACVLVFDHYRQVYRLPCAVRELAPGDPARAASIWHNRLFNPNLPDDVRVLGFQPDWSAAEAAPGPQRPNMEVGGPAPSV
jgi:hypothetical protein